MSQSGSVLKEGWAIKCGGFWKTWHRRWFVLTDHLLEYSKQPGILPQGSIDLNEATEISKCPECKKQPALQIVLPERTYYIVPDTEKEMDEWVEALKKAKSTIAESPSNTSKGSYKILRYIAHGLHSNILEVKKASSEKKFIAKRYAKEIVESKKDQLSKIKMLVGGKISFVCPIIDIVEDDKSIMIILEQQPYTLKEILHSWSSIPLIADSVFAEIVSGLNNLHSQGLLYGDFHISNVLVDRHGHISLVPPCFTFPINANIERYVSYFDPNAVDVEIPERKSDFWGASVIYFQMKIGFVPYSAQDLASLKEEVKIPLSFPIHTPTQFQKQIVKLLSPEVLDAIGSIVTEQVVPETESKLTDFLPKVSESKKFNEPIGQNDIMILTFAPGSALNDQF